MGQNVVLIHIYMFLTRELEENALIPRQLEPFLLIDDGTEDRIMVFGTQFNLRVLCEAEFIVADGTFSVQPKIFAQLYVFHAPYLQKVLPSLFCLMPDKTYNSYLRLLQLIINKASSFGLVFKPRKIHIDYERTMIKAISNVFSIYVIQGCLFHFAQCLYRKVQELGFSVAYRECPSVHLWIKRFSALPFLPISRVTDGYMEVVKACPDPIEGKFSIEQITAFQNYMMCTWIHRENAIYEIQVWNQFFNHGPRTTNNAEGWNSKLNALATGRKSFFQFVRLLQKIQIDIDVDRMTVISSPVKKNKKYEKIDASIRLAKLNFSRTEYTDKPIPILMYLDSVSFATKLD